MPFGSYQVSDEQAVAYSILVEAVPPEVTAFLAKLPTIPVYSIGAGLCDEQLIISQGSRS